jgi:hypothetical protein
MLENLLSQTSYTDQIDLPWEWLQQPSRPASFIGEIGRFNLFSLPIVHQKAKKIIRLVHPFYLPFSAVAIFASSICIVEFFVAFILELVLV